MRLLNVHKLELEIFDRQKPRYAIASHRWIDGAEASFQDVQAKRNLDRPGDKKIKNLAAFVRDRLHDVDYLWIDTCCIDKSNSQELQEAITAMYKWYEGSVICLAYLSDVEEHRDPIEQMRRSVWFTRGWTLQELLAPRSVLFLSAAWEVIGHKAQEDDSTWPLDELGPSLHREIAFITRIPESILTQPERRKSLSLEARLAWMEGRTTTRPEDMAYSLLGLFEVSMPLIYEEGKAAAERRLRRAIAEADEYSSFGINLGRPQGAPGFITSDTRYEPAKVRVPPSSTVPYLRDPAFVDRAELHSLEQKLSANAVRVVLMGLGGAGKSQVAIEYCYRFRERHPDTWVLWVHANSETRYEESLRTLAVDMNIPGHEDVNLEICELVYRWLLNFENGKWLLVLDNADDAGFLFEPPNATENEAWLQQQRNKGRRTRLDLVPKCAHGSTIVTTRYRGVAAKMVDDQEIILVPPMSQDESMALLNGKLGYVHDYAPVSMKRLTGVLEYMPLAITQAATYITKRMPRYSIEQYIEKLETCSKSKSKLLAAASVDLRRDPHAENSILLTLEISFRHLHSVRSSAADLLSLMSFFDHHGIPEYLLRLEQAAQDKHEDPATNCNDRRSGSNSSDPDTDESFEEDIATLRDYNLITISPSGKELKMHSLVQLAAQRWLEKEGQHGRWMAQSLRNLNSVFPTGNFEDWPECEALYPHARLTLDLVPTTPDACIEKSGILYKAATFALERGSWFDAEILITCCRNDRERMLGEENEATLQSTKLLVRALQVQAKYETSEKLCQRALEVSITHLGPEHPTTLSIFSQLAAGALNQGKSKECERLARHASKVQEKVLGNGHLDTLKTLLYLSVSLLDEGKYAEAEHACRRVVTGREKALGPKHPHTLESLRRLAQTLKAKGRYEESGRIFRRVIRMTRVAMGPEHPETLASRYNLALLLDLQGKNEETEQEYRHLFKVYTRVLGPDHPDTTNNLDCLAMTLNRQGKCEAAEQCGRRASEAYRKALGPDHPSTLGSLHNLALVLGRQGKYDESESTYRYVLKKSIMLLGREHPQTLGTLENLAGLLSEQGKYVESERMSRHAREASIRSLGPKHPWTLTVEGNLAIALSRQGRHAESEPLFRHALESLTTSLGPQHPRTLARVTRLAMTLSYQGKHAEAESLDRRALQVQESLLGPDHPDTLRSMRNLAFELQAQGKWTEAKQMQKRVEQRRKKKLLA